jgi:hypothetical protein
VDIDAIEAPAPPPPGRLSRTPQTGADERHPTREQLVASSPWALTGYDPYGHLRSVAHFWASAFAHVPSPAIREETFELVSYARTQGPQRGYYFWRRTPLSAEDYRVTMERRRTPDGQAVVWAIRRERYRHTIVVLGTDFDSTPVGMLESFANGFPFPSGSDKWRLFTSEYLSGIWKGRT